MADDRVEQIGLATLYLGDCREIAPSLTRPSAVISDPPYGQGFSSPRRKALRPASRGGKLAVEARGRERVVGDSTPFDPSWLISLADETVLWGAHKFWPRLPEHGRWLFWDKRVGLVPERTQGCGEMAWHNRCGPVRVFRHLWDGICVADRRDLAAGRVHPTQKPVALMRWCIEQARVPAGGSILDPYMGSGSTGVATVQMGHPFIGIEIDPQHFETACGRLDEAQRQSDLFVCHSETT